MLQELTREVDALTEIDLSLMCDSEMRESTITLRRLIDRQEAIASALPAGIHGRGIPAGDGACSTPAWMQWKTGQRIGEAKASLRAGRMCASLPLTAKAWRQGEISASGARTICRGSKAGHEDVYRALEEMLVARAAAHDMRRLDARIAYYRARADALDNTDPSERNGLRHSPVGDRWKSNGNYDGLAGAIVNEALLAAADKPSHDDPRSRARRLADASLHIHRFFLEHADLPSEDGERPHLSLLITEDPGTGKFTCRDGAISSDAIEQLLCNARLSCIVLGANRIPLEAGQITYRPSPRLRRAVIARDGGCRFEGCHRSARWTEVHHVISWPGGPTKLDNLVCVCDYHHHLLHKPGWRATFDGITLRVTKPNGDVLDSS